MIRLAQTAGVDPVPQKVVALKAAVMLPASVVAIGCPADLLQAFRSVLADQDLPDDGLDQPLGDEDEDRDEDVEDVEDDKAAEAA